jgi:hypothetical protein
MKNKATKAIPPKMRGERVWLFYFADHAVYYFAGESMNASASEGSSVNARLYAKPGG